ncbi:hypothetical protein TrLO_g9408 [Triparma laevis f. longispina]|uniref:Derlin n=1 Tax=Triparma laevis f. longispina TaxID=1714387 RepID=A0A9W7E696_9STRA|nr:hypothetical protein TrLO_g9408 [Triparma laevis f. longispina]
MLSWYFDIPPITRSYLTLSFLLTSLTTLDLISPFSLYFNSKLILQGQYYRLLTSFGYFGTFSLDFLFHCYFLVRYCRLLEESEFQRRRASFIIFLVFGMTIMLGFAPFLRLNFLGSSLTFMMLYVWGRRNEHVQMQIFGVLNFTAPYLPLVMLFLSAFLGNSTTIDALGIIAGHCFYFLEYVYPKVAEIRGWRIKKILEPPEVLRWFCGDMN